MIQISDKYSVQVILQYLKDNNVKNIVLCPGSRNAPFIVSLAQDNYFNIISIVDERTAGFIALGIIKETQFPAVIICTSGSAVLNLAPAVLEAYYQDLPLFIFTADRPENSVNKGENQTFNQLNVFNNYIKYQESLKENDSIENYECILNSTHKHLFNSLNKGPVHLNFPFTEPLYNKVQYLKVALNNNELYIDNQRFKYDFLKKYLGKKVLIYISTIDFNLTDIVLLNELALGNNWVVFSEITSNISGPNILHNIDLILDKIPINHYPELVITSGGQMLSKKFRNFLKSNAAIVHIDINNREDAWDFFSNQYIKIQAHLGTILNELSVCLGSNNTSFCSTWKEQHRDTLIYQKEFFNKTIFSEFHCINKLISNFEPNSSVYWGNSSVIRYANWSMWNHSTLNHFANRGVSGIEGVLATSIGAKYANKSKKMYCVLGDLSALYESNSFWASTIIEDITVIVLNNNGGKIFNNIQKELKSNESKLIETPHNFTLSNIAQMYYFQYFNINNISDFNANISNYLALEGKNLIELIFDNSTYKYWNFYFDEFKLQV